MSIFLGKFVFQDMEVPEQINFGGPHVIVKHQLIGGGRTLDAMGDDPAPIEWSGIFLYGDAANRARALDAMKVSGATFQLTWGTFSRRVKISRFDAVYKFEYQIPYRITVEVLPSPSDQTAAQPLDRTIRSAFDKLGRLQLGVRVAEAVAAAQRAVASVIAASSTGQVADAPIEAKQAALVTVQSSADALVSAQRAADAALAETDLSALPGLGVQDYAAALLGLTGGAADLSEADTAVAYMNQIASNLALSGS